MRTRASCNTRNYELRYTKLQFERGPALRFGVTQLKEFLHYNLRGFAFKQRCYYPAFGVLKPLNCILMGSWFEVLLQSVCLKPYLVTFYDIHGRKREVLFFFCLKHHTCM
jgi:hypothetical protein